MITSIKTPTSLRFIPRVNEGLVSFPDVVLDRYARDFDLDHATALEHATELIRYLAMCADKPYAQYGMSGQVDEVWHVFILHTKEYSDWCQELFGYFMHHTPTLPEEKEAAQNHDGPDTYALFYRDYSLFYGGEPPVIWPAPHIVSNDCGGGGCGGGGSSCGSSSCNSSSCNSSPSSCSSSPAIVPPSDPSRRSDDDRRDSGRRKRRRR